MSGGAGDVFVCFGWYGDGGGGVVLEMGCFFLFFNNFLQHLLNQD